MIEKFICNYLGTRNEGLLLGNIGLLSILYWLWILIFDSGNNPKPTQETKTIAILGLKGSGKTTLWKRLRNEECHKGEEYPTQKTEHFKDFKTGNKLILQPCDIPGDSEVVDEYYRELIKEGTFIYYLIDINSLSDKDTKKKNTSRLLKIAKILKENSEIKNIGFNLIITCYDEKKNGTKEEARKQVLSSVNSSSLWGKVMEILKKSKTKNVIEITKIGDLFDDKFMDEIRNDISLNNSKISY